MKIPEPGERYEPMPGLLGMPAFTWRRMSRRARRIALLAALVIGAGVVVALIRAPALMEQQREERAALRAEIAARLERDQRPRRATLPPAAAVADRLERAIVADVRDRHARGLLSGAPQSASCKRVTPRDTRTHRAFRTPGHAYFSCFVRSTTAETTAGRLETGYRFRARHEIATGLLSWCKLNPRPIHPEQEDFVRVPLSDECVAPARAPGRDPR